MRLAELEPQLVGDLVPGKSHRYVDSLALAQGVYFICPTCRNHSVLVWFRDRGVPDGESPGPGRWVVSGIGLDDLTLSPSIQIRCWHGFVTNGEIR